MPEPKVPRNTMACPKCNAVAIDITPTKSHDRSMAVFACTACKFAFKADGGAYVENAEQLRDVFRGATLGRETLMKAFAGEKLNPATAALFQARLLEYGLQMWFDGLKQGILLSTFQQEGAKNGDEQSGSELGSAARGAPAGGSPADAANAAGDVGPDQNRVG